MYNVIRRLLMVFLAFTFIFSAVMSGTYAWENEQQALNDLTGEKTKLIRVELMKLEKNSGTPDEEVGIAGTHFYLFRESGEQIGSRYVTDENGKISLSLSSGKYYFEEITPALGYTFDVDENGDKITKYPFEVADDDVTVYVKAYNTKLSGSLVISKTVINSDDSPLSELQMLTLFEFTVTFSDKGSYDYRIHDSELMTLKSGGTLRLTHGQSAVFENLPFGLHYTVTETPLGGYISSSTGNQGNITDSTSHANFVNKCEVETLGSIIVSKEVQGEGAETEKEFSFVLKFGLNEVPFTLKHSEIKTFERLPYGVPYMITEDISNLTDYKPEVREYKGVIVKSKRIKIKYVNIFEEKLPDEPTALSIRKTVVGEKADPDKEFKFVVVFKNGEDVTREEFTLKAGESKTFDNLDSDITYTVTETDSGGYTPTIDRVNGTVIDGVTVNVEFVNLVPDIPLEPEIVTLTVSKILSGDILPSHNLIEFEFTLLVDGEKNEFKLKPGESITFEVPVGAVYELYEEDYSSLGFAQSIYNGYGVVDKEPISIEVVNELVTPPVVEIKGTKNWVLPDSVDVELPESITVRLKNGDVIVEEKVVTPVNGVWNYAFIAPKYNTDGSLAEYTVEEKAVDHFKTTYDGFNITNTYVEEITVGIPVVKKAIVGENAPAQRFEFVLRSDYNAPMPQGAQENKFYFMIDGAGQADLGTLVFNKTGEYVYLVSELIGSTKGFTYDNSCYVITFVVKEKNNKLYCEQKITCNDIIVDEVVFTNIYDDDGTTNEIVISGKKTWNHGNNSKASQPKSIIVEVYGDGVLAAQREVTENDNWEYSFKLARYASDGHEIVYTIDEVPVKNYKRTINGYDLINIYEGETTPTEDNTSPIKPNPPGGTSPPTGDEFNAWLYFILMLLSFVGLVILWRFKPDSLKWKSD